MSLPNAFVSQGVGRTVPRRPVQPPRQLHPFPQPAPSSPQQDKHRLRHILRHCVAPYPSASAGVYPSRVSADHLLYLAMFMNLWHRSVFLPLHGTPTNKPDKILLGFLELPSPYDHPILSSPAFFHHAV